VGFSLRRNPEDGHIEVTLSKRSKERIDTKIREMTPRTWGQSFNGCITKLNAYLRGWINFFGSSCHGSRGTDASQHWTLTSGGACGLLLLRQWNRKRFIVRRLIRMGARATKAWKTVYEGRKSLWALSHCGSVSPTPSVMCTSRNRGFSHWSSGTARCTKPSLRCR
jgi:RNA-directed DNA polymerase